MAVVELSIPEPMKDWIEAQAKARRFETTSDYVRDLIRQEQEKVDAIAELELLIEEGFESGISDRSMEEVLDEARAAAKARLGV